MFYGPAALGTKGLAAASLPMVVAGIEPTAFDGLLAHLLTLKGNLRSAIADRANDVAEEKKYA